MPRTSALLVGIGALALVLSTSSCRSLRRDINQSLPGFLRSDPGAKQTEIIRLARRAREYTPAERERQVEQLALARDLMDRGEPSDAADELLIFLEEFPDSEFDEEVRYLLIKANYDDDEFGEVWSQLLQFGARFPVTERSPEVLGIALEVAESYLRGDESYLWGLFGNTQRGRDILEWLVRSYPATPTAADAQWLLANDAIENTKFEEGALAFDFFVDQYPTNALIDRAYYLRAWCRWRQVKGTFYDPEVKQIAREQFQEFLDRNPDLPDLVADATTRRDELLQEEARYYLEVGQWYLDQDRPFSARYYLAFVISFFPTSDAADEARELLPDDELGATAGGAGS